MNIKQAGYFPYRKHVAHLIISYHIFHSLVFNEPMFIVIDSAYPNNHPKVPIAVVDSHRKKVKSWEEKLIRVTSARIDPCHLTKYNVAYPQEDAC
jgi:hypothetical protein